MLEKVDLSITYPKEKFKSRLGYLRNRLYDLQKTCWEGGIGSIIVFEGWDAAGKGSSINLLTQRLDPRGFKLYPIQAPRTHELHMPWLWRFWLKIPNYGEMAIFDRSWYGRVVVEKVEKLTPDTIVRKAYQDIVDFERGLAADGYVIIKFLLHISKKEQTARFKTLEKDPLESWHVSPEDWDHHHKYDDYLLAYEEMLERTDTEWGPWTIVEATDKRWTRIKIFETIVQRLEETLKARGKPLPPEPTENATDGDDNHIESSGQDLAEPTDTPAPSSTAPTAAVSTTDTPDADALPTDTSDHPAPGNHIAEDTSISSTAAAESEE